MVVKVLVAAAVLVAVAVAVALWRRPPRRLAGATLAGVGVRDPSIVQFSTRYCNPCKAAAPRLRAAAKRVALAYVQIDVGERTDVARELGIRTVPTIAVTGAGGRVVRVWTTVPPDAEIAEAAHRATSVL